MSKEQADGSRPISQCVGSNQGATSVREIIQILGLRLRRIYENVAAVSPSVYLRGCPYLQYTTSALASAAASSYTPTYLDIIDSANGGTAVPLPTSSRSSSQSSTSTRITSVPIPGTLYKQTDVPLHRECRRAHEGEDYAGISPGTPAPHVQRIQYMGVLFIAEATAPRGQVRVIDTTTS